MPSNLERLPDEILLNIIEQLNNPPSHISQQLPTSLLFSASQIRQWDATVVCENGGTAMKTPTVLPPEYSQYSEEQLLSVITTPLKSLSLVSRRFRLVTFPTLFSAIKIRVGHYMEWSFQFGRLNLLTDRTLHGSIGRVRNGSAYISESLGIPARVLKAVVRSVCIYVPSEDVNPMEWSSFNCVPQALFSIWDMALPHLDPTKLVIVAPPVQCAALLSCQSYGCNFISGPYQRIELERLDFTKHKRFAKPLPRSDDKVRHNLLERFPTSSFEIDEGYALCRSRHIPLSNADDACSILIKPKLFEQSPQTTLKRFTYRAIYPFADSHQEAIDAILKMSSLEELALQFSPPESYAPVLEPALVRNIPYCRFYSPGNSETFVEHRSRASRGVRQAYSSFITALLQWSQYSTSESPALAATERTRANRRPAPHITTFTCLDYRSWYIRSAVDARMAALVRRAPAAVQARTFMPREQYWVPHHVTEDLEAGKCTWRYTDEHGYYFGWR